MAGVIWFGTREYMRWVPAPAINMTASKVGWETQTNYLDGGAYVRRSINAHKEFDLAWNLTSRENVRMITDYADGVYGVGSIYWADPFTMNANMLPMSFAVPVQGIYDGKILSGKTARPTTIQTSANTLGYPAQSAVYTIGAEAKPNVWIPIPPGHTAWVGAHGIAGTGGVVVATPTTGPSSTGTPVNLTLLSVTSTTRVNQSFNSASYDGVQISLGGTGTITLAGIIVQVLPTGTTPALGGFISGQGQSGSLFASQPTLTQYSAALDKVGLTAKLVEVDQWR